jgi:hypothetical protein
VPSASTIVNRLSTKIVDAARSSPGSPPKGWYERAANATSTSAGTTSAAMEILRVSP